MDQRRLSGGTAVIIVGGLFIMAENGFPQGFSLIPIPIP